MVKIHYAFIIMIYCACFASAASAANASSYINISLESENVYLGDRIVLIVESAGLQDPPDISLISNSANIERETVGTRITVLGGKVVEVKIHRAEFTAEKIGTFVFGPLESEGVTSNSVAIKVEAAVDSDWQPEENDLALDFAVSTTQPYVNAQLTLDIRLTHQYPITEEVISLPDFDGFVVRSVFAERRTFTAEPERLRQTAWRYLLFPEQSGTHKIGAITWSGVMVKSRAERAKFEKRSADIDLAIQASKSDAADWWLPTQNLSLSENWSEEVTSLTAGDEITRTIKVNASNVLAGQIPTPIVLESRALQQTLISTNRQEEITQNGMLANAEFVYRIKAQSPIPVFMDTVRFAWWDTNSDQAREAIIPARRINIGLPDRADLLQKLAQQETGVSNLQHWWQSANRSRSALYALTLLGLLAVGVYLFRRVVSNIKNTVLAMRARHALRTLAKRRQWAEL